jgi:hypothetical protein
VKPFIPQKGQVTKPPQKTWMRKEKMNEETQRQLRRKKFDIDTKNLGSRATDEWENVRSIILRYYMKR